MLLAPVVDDRKGEHARVVEGLRSQGFIRARIDGRLHELDDPIELDAKRRHSIEAVVDRFRVREDLALRLAESFETALALSDGRALVAPLDSDDDGGGEDTVFSARFACHVCGYAIPELEPRIFSFNNPAGACQRCDGLGVQTFFDPARIVAHPELSLPGGAVRGWDRRNFYYFQMVRSLAAHYGFDIDTPFRDLPPRGARRDPERERHRGHPVHVSHRAARRLHPHPSLRGRDPQHGAPVPGDGVDRGPRRAREVPRHPRVRVVRRRPAQPGRAQRLRRGRDAARPRRAADPCRT